MKFILKQEIANLKSRLLLLSADIDMIEWRVLALDLNIAFTSKYEKKIIRILGYDLSVCRVDII